MRVFSAALLLLGATLGFADLSYRFSLAPSEVVVTPTENGFVSVACPTLPEAAVVTRPGDPALPSVGLPFLLPPGTEVAGLRIDTLETAFLAKGIPEPRRLETPTGISLAPQIGPNARVYQGTALFPPEVVQLGAAGNMGGYRVAEVRINPVLFDPQTGTLRVVTRLVFTLETQPARRPGVVPRRVVQGSRQALEEVVRHFVVNPEMLARYRHRIPEVPLQQVRFRTGEPSPRQLSDGPYAYLIVTDTAFVEALRPLADFHTARGLPAVIYTVDWIRDHYPGRNLADRIRNFVRDAYEEWGVQYLLLAGDADFVPYQSIWQDPYYGNDTDASPPSDWFFSNLDGDWNLDGDEYIGELADSVDYFPELLVGRVPLNTPEQAELFVQKVLIHSTFPGGDSLLLNTQYLSRFILAASYLDNSNGWGYEKAERVDPSVPSYFQRTKVYQTPTHQVSVEEFVNAVNQGAGLMFVEAHGSYPFFAVNKDPYIPFGIPELEELSNRNEWPILQIATCHSAGWDKTSVVEYLLLGTDGGIIGGIGTTRLDFPGVDIPMNRLFFRAFFETPAPVLGQGLAYVSRHAWAAQHYSITRYVYFSKALLGDPAMPVWPGPPGRLAVQVSPDTLQLGGDTVVVEVRNAETGEPVPNAALILWQPGHALYLQSTTGADGTARIPLQVTAPDSLLLTAYASGFVLHRKVLPVAPQGAALRLVEVWYADSSYGDADGIPEAAESLQVRLRFTNPGTEPTAASVVRLLSLNPYTLVPPDSALLGPVVPGDTAKVSLPLYLVPETPDARYLKILVQVQPAGSRTDTLPEEFGAAVDTLRMWVQASRPRIVRIYHQLQGDTLLLWPEVVNEGHDDGWNVVLRVRAASTFTEVLDSVYVLGHLAPQSVHFDTLFHSPIRVRALTGNLFWVRELWSVEDDRGRGDTVILHATREISAPSNIRVEPHPEGVRVVWHAPAYAQAYLVFRRLEGEASWTRLTLTPWRQREYIDPGIPYGREAFYRIVAIDDYRNSSPASFEVSGTGMVSLLEGWPVQYEGGGESHHPVVGDFDPSYPGLEIVFGTSTGKVYAFHADGTPVQGWPITLDAPAQVWNSVALGDLDNDGQLELVVAPRMIDRVYAFEHDGTPVAGWPVDFNGGGNPGQEVSRMGAYAAPVLYDLDGDGQLEVLIHGMSGKVWCWHADGTPYLEGSDGLFANLWAYHWDAGGLAVGDLDGDDSPEVVVASISSSGILWAFRADGSQVPGFPIAQPLGSSDYCQSGVAIGDFDQERPGLEIAFVWSHPQGSAEYRYLSVVDASGQFLPNLHLRSVNVAGGIYTRPVLADINNDDQLELLISTLDGILAFDTLGNQVGDMLFQFYQPQNFAQPILADVNGDNINEVFGVHGDGYIYGWSQGQVLPGFPVFVNNEIKTTPVVADLDQDGDPELVALGLERVYVFDLQGVATFSDYAWPMFQHDIYHTGNAEENPWWRRGRKGTQGDSRPVVLRWQLARPLPNPARREVRFTLSVPEARAFRLEVYNAAGRRLRILHEGSLAPGVHTLAWNLKDQTGRRVPPGLYFLRLQAPKARQTQRVLVLP